jgi:hypothetical protein
MCRLPAARVTRLGAITAGVALLAALAVASPALAATRGASSPAVPIAGLGDLLGGLTHAVLGGVDWTVNVAGDFVLNLLGGIVEKLIPRSWIHKGLEIMSWLVAVSDYTARVTAPGGGHAYGFAGVNALRGLYLWLGMAIAPLTLVYATSRSWSGQGDPPHVPLTRVLIVAVALLNYAWLWSQAVAITNQITHAILGISAVTSGVQKMFEVLIAGAALGGLPLIGLLVMGAGGLQLLALIFVKVALILVGALVYAIGPLMIGLVATDRGNAFACTWLTIASGLFVLPILWASIFAIAAVLVNDAGGGASVIGGSSTIGQILGGLLIALAAIAAFWLNIKLTKGFAGLVGGQLAGLLALAGGGARALLGGAGRAGSSNAAAAAAGGGAVASLRGFASKVGGAAAGAAGVFAPRDARGQVALGGRAGAALSGAGALARGGLIGAGGALASQGLAAAATTRAGQVVASSRAGSVATRAARGAHRGWNRAARNSTHTPTPGRRPGASPADTPPIPAAAQTPTAAATTATDAGGPGKPGEGGRPLAGSPSTRPRGATSTRPAPTPPAAGSSRDAGAASQPPPADSANDAARAAFGQPRAAKPTRSPRHPFGGRKP